MICNTPYPDRNKRIVIIDRLERLCIQCGGFCELRPADGTRACLRCGGTQYVECYESDAAEWRAEIEKAQEIVAENKADFFYLIKRGFNAVANLDGMELVWNSKLGNLVIEKGVTR